MWPSFIRNSGLKQGLCTRPPVSQWNWTKHKGKEKFRLYVITKTKFLFPGIVHGLCSDAGWEEVGRALFWGFQTPSGLFCTGFFLWSSWSQFRAVDHHIPLEVRLQTSLSNPRCFWNKHRDKSRQDSFSSQGPGGWQLQLWFSKKAAVALITRVGDVYTFLWFRQSSCSWLPNSLVCLDPSWAEWPCLKWTFCEMFGFSRKAHSLPEARGCLPGSQLCGHSWVASLVASVDSRRRGSTGIDSAGRENDHLGKHRGSTAGSRSELGL